MQRRRFNNFGPGGGGFGGMRLGPGLPLTPAVKALLVANVGVFLLTRVLGLDELQLGQTFGLVPAQVFAGGRLWQLITYMFLHGGLWHIAVNMLMLWMFGTTVAHRWGDRDFLTYYFVCGVGAALTMWITGPTSMGHTIGASGAVLGLLLAYALMFPDREVLLYFVIRIKMKYLVWGLVAIDLLAGLSTAQTGVAHFAHLGGMAFGWLYLKQDWRLAAFSRKVRAQRAKAKMAQNTQRQEKRKGANSEVDRILEKISSQGIDSLTETERNVLRNASRH
jgi:rhomboid family protein